MVKIKFQVLMTGSDGNCCLLNYKNTTILIDAGFQTKSKMEEILNPVLMKYKIDAIIITHEHTDHLSQWTGRLSMDYNIPIYLHEKHIEREQNRKTKYLSYIDRKNNVEKEAKLHFIKENEEFQIEDLTIYPFTVYHDAAKTLGFRFNKDMFAYVSDCGFLSNNIKKELLKVHNLALEFNYDKNLIMNSERFWQNKDRSLGIFGHLCNEEAVNFIIWAKTKFNHKFKNIITLHSSALHNSEYFIEKEMHDKFEELEDTIVYISKRENNNEIDLGD